MTKKQKLQYIFNFCRAKCIDWHKITKEDLYFIMKTIDEKQFNKFINETNDDYNGLLK